jgi:hypothetical protein
MKANGRDCHKRKNNKFKEEERIIMNKITDMLTNISMCVGLLCAFTLGLSLQGFSATLGNFMGSESEYAIYQQNLAQINSLVSQKKTPELYQKLHDIFSENTALNVQIAVARNLPSILANLPAADIAGFVSDISSYFTACNNEINRIESQQNIAAADWRKLDSLYNLREALISAVAKTNYFSAANPAEQLNKLISIIDERDPIRTNPEAVSWALRKLPEAVSSSVDSQAINSALQGLENSFLYDSIRYVLDNTKKELDLIFTGYSNNQDRTSINLSLLNNCPNQIIKKHAYDRLFKGPICDDICQSEKIIFLKSGTKDTRLFEEEVDNAKILLPKVTITNITPQGPYREGANIVFSADVQPREGGGPIQYSWLLMDSQGNLLQSNAGETATFSFPNAGIYEVGVEVKQTVSGEKLVSLMATTDIQILPEK